MKEKVEKEINDTIQKLQNANYVISEEEVLNYSLIIKNVLPDYKEVFFSLVLKQNHRFIKFFNVYRYARDYTVDERIISNIILQMFTSLIIVLELSLLCIFSQKRLCYNTTYGIECQAFFYF